MITIDHGTSALVDREERSSDQIFYSVSNKQTLGVAGDVHVGKDDLDGYSSECETLARSTNTQTLDTAGGVPYCESLARINKTRRL